MGSLIAFHVILRLSIALNILIGLVWLLVDREPVGPWIITMSARSWIERETKFYGWLYPIIDAVAEMFGDRPDHCQRAAIDYEKGNMWTYDARS